MENDIRTWEGGDESDTPDEKTIMFRVLNPNLPTPETEAEEI